MFILSIALTVQSGFQRTFLQMVHSVKPTHQHVITLVTLKKNCLMCLAIVWRGNWWLYLWLSWAFDLWTRELWVVSRICSVDWLTAITDHVPGHWSDSLNPSCMSSGACCDALATAEARESPPHVFNLFQLQWCHVQFMNMLMICLALNSHSR